MIKQYLFIVLTIALANPTLAAINTEKAIFAGGCFWCMEPPFDKLEGVISTTSGYTGGHQKSPSYEDVSGGRSGHVESVQIVYDPKKISYEKLLEVFWINIDPLNDKGQFCDNGSQYLSAIFYLNEAQKAAAEKSLEKLDDSNVLKGKIVTTIRPAAIFYPAEHYHQDYYQKNPYRYKTYRYICGRDQRLKQLWRSYLKQNKS
jgi:peptide-methionine (S)-S-oxide reductase